MEQNEVQGIKISQLDELTSIQDDDVLASVDTSEIKTTKVKASTLKSYINKEVNNEITTIKNDYALKTSIPTKTSQLNNDSGFIDKSVNNLDNYYKKTEIDTKVQAIDTTTDSLNTRLTTAEKNIEINKTDIKDLSNRTKRIETDIFDSGEASGTGINLQDSTLAEFQEVKVDGVGNQVTTNGNQILDFANPTSKSVGVTSTFENDILTIVGTAGSTYQSVTWKLSKTFLENNKGKTIKYKHKSAKISNQEASSNVQISVGYTDDTPAFYKRIYNFNTLGTDTYVIPSDISNISYINVGIYTNNSASTDVENTITIEEPLLYFDDNDTYEPYTGGEPSPSPDYKQPIEVITEDFDLVSCGNQLLDIKNGKKSSGVSFGFSNDILTVNCEPGTSYQSLYFDFTDIVKNNPGKKIYYKDESNSITDSNSKSLIQFSTKKSDDSITYNAIYNFVTKTPTPYIIPEDTSDIKTVSLNILVNNTSETNISNTIKMVKPIISFNDNDTYEPYTETRQTITMPEREFAGKIDDTYKDQFRINYNEEDGKYHLYLDKVVGKVVLDGSDDENILYQDTYNGFSLYKFANYNIENRDKSICNYYRYGVNKSGCFAFSSDGNYIFIYDYRYNKTLDYKNWLSTHNTEVYYVLKEPYTLDLGVVNMPLSYYPITNVYNTCVGIPNMYVKYYRDFKKTVTTMQVDIQELKSTIQELTNNQTKLLSQINTIKENQVVEEESEVVQQ